jgi:hypothetical protein
MRSSSDWACAKEECCRFFLEGGVVVAALSWNIYVRETLP